MAKDTVKNDNLISSKYTMARVAPRKVVNVANAIRGMKVDQAIRFLDFNDKKASDLIKGVVMTAIANGTHNKGMEKESMYVADVKIGPGKIRKVGRFAAKGSFKPIWKRTTHITVILGANEKPKTVEKAEPAKKETK